MPYDQILNHTNICIHKVIECNHCKELVTRKNLSNHKSTSITCIKKQLESLKLENEKLKTISKKTTCDETAMMLKSLNAETMLEDFIIFQIYVPNKNNYVRIYQAYFIVTTYSGVIYTLKNNELRFYCGNLIWVD